MSTPRTPPARRGRSTPRSTAPPSTPTASATPPGTSTPRVSRIRSACSATSTPWCGSRSRPVHADPEDTLTDTFLLGPVPDIAVAERQQYLTDRAPRLPQRRRQARPGRRERAVLRPARPVARRDLLRARRSAPTRTASSPATSSATACCCRTTGPVLPRCAAPCTLTRPTGIDGQGILDGVSAELGGPAVAANPLNGPARVHLTSDELPARTTRSPPARPTSTYRGAASVNPFGLVEG